MCLLTDGNSFSYFNTGKAALQVLRQRETRLEQHPKIMRKVQRSRNRRAALPFSTGVSPSASSALPCPRFLCSLYFRELLQKERPVKEGAVHPSRPGGGSSLERIRAGWEPRRILDSRENVCYNKNWETFPRRGNDKSEYKGDR